MKKKVKLKCWYKKNIEYSHSVASANLTFNNKTTFHLSGQDWISKFLDDFANFVLRLGDGWFI